jgi:hypothetical protein
VIPAGGDEELTPAIVEALNEEIRTIAARADLQLRQYSFSCRD